MRLVEEAKFKNSFIFKYSERPGTKAADRYPDDIPEEVKKRRNNDLLAVQNANSLADHRQWIGKSVRVLVEGPSRHGERVAAGPVRQLTGRTMTDHIAVFDAPERVVGQTLTVDIDDASGFTLYGRARTDEVVGVTGEAAPPPRPRRVGLHVV
jgi:tRNA-2-methylthio-N6-dimethylallyladenosine synthase